MCIVIKWCETWVLSTPRCGRGANFHDPPVTQSPSSFARPLRLYTCGRRNLDNSSTHHLFWGGLSKPGPKCARTYSCTSVRAGSGVSCRYNLPVRRPLARAMKKTGTLGRQRLKFPTRPIDSDSLDGVRRKLLPCHYPVLSSRLQPCTSCQRV